MVILEEGGIRVTGQGAHTDIIMASAKAYVNAPEQTGVPEAP